MTWRSTPPLWKLSFEIDSATEPSSGNSDRHRMTMTVGQMNSHLAAPSERQAPSVEDARRETRSNELALDAKARDVGGELLVLADLVGDLVPAVRDGLLGAGLVELARQVLGDRRVEDVLLVALRLRDPHVEHHVLVLEGGLDGAEVVLRGVLAEARILPRLEVA